MYEGPPRVLFVDESAGSLDRILCEIEPVMMSFSLRTAEPLQKYIDDLRPEAVVISDRIRFRHRDAAWIVSDLRSRYDGGILVLAESIDERDRALWKKRGATDCILHPARVTERLKAMTKKILDVVVRPSGHEERSG